MKVNGKTIRELRKKKGLTLQQLADLSGMHRANLNMLELYDQHKPNVDHLAAIAAALEVPIETLLGDSTPPESIVYPILDEIEAMKEASKLSDNWLQAPASMFKRGKS